MVSKIEPVSTEPESDELPMDKLPQAAQRDANKGYSMLQITLFDYYFAACITAVFSKPVSNNAAAIRRAGEMAKEAIAVRTQIKKEL